MRKLKFIFALALVFLFPFTAQALSPEDALSARPADSFYAVARIDDLNGLLKGIFSQENIEMVTSVLSPEDAQGVKMVAAFASQVPANSVALSFGMEDISDIQNTPNGEPPFFLQVAASMPASVRAKLDKIADGSASAVEIATLLLGDGGIMLSPVFKPEIHKWEKGTYYTLEGQVAFAAKDDLLLIALTPDELGASIGALEDEKNRLVLKRRFNSPNFLSYHMDFPIIMELAQKAAEDKGKPINPDEFAKIFKAPFEIELDFSSKPESFLVSVAANVIESMNPEFFSGVKPSDGAGMFFAGGGKLLAGFAAPLVINISQMTAMDPEFAEIWDEAGKELEKLGISAADVENLVNGTLSVAFGSDATIMGKRAPGGYIALTGREGAAAKILAKIMENDDITANIPFIPLEADGWDSLFAVDPSMSPVPVAFGAMGDTLFAGVVDPGAIGKTPEMTDDFAEVFDAPLFAAGVFDAAGIWDLLRREIADPDSLLSIGAANVPEPIMELMKSVMEAELSVPLVKLWTPGPETSYLEFMTVDVPEEKRLLTRVMDIVKMFIAM